MGIAKVEFVGTDLVGSIDADQDGEASVKLSAKIAELLTEFSGGKGEFKKTSFEFKGSKLIVSADLNQDGDASLVLEIDLAEGFAEVSAKVIKA